MSAIRSLWSMVRGHRSRFGPAGPATCVCADGARDGMTFATPESRTGAGDERQQIPQPDLALLCADGEKLLQQARAHGRAPALAVMQIDDRPELELAFGRTGAERVMAAVMAGLTRAAGGQGLIVRTAADTFALLMPGGGAGAAIAALQARFGKPCAIEIAFGRGEILVVPDVMVHPVGPQDAIGQVYEDLCRYIAKARRHGWRAGEGEQQRAPCGLVAASSPIRPAAPAPAPAPRYAPPQPATIPVPLAMH